MSPALPVGDVADRVERLVIGADYGADGYTTRAQADELARRRTAIDAIEAGLLRRSLFLGTRPPRTR